MSSLRGEGRGWLRDLLRLCLGFPITHVLGRALRSTLHEAGLFLQKVLGVSVLNIKRARKMQTNLPRLHLISWQQKERKKERKNDTVAGQV